jgi:hypothetical protein
MATYYFCDNQSGAITGVVVGNNLNNGTSPSTPWRTFAALSQVGGFSGLQPGDVLAFAEGSDVAVTMSNIVSPGTAAGAITFTSYTPPTYDGQGVQPKLSCPTGNQFFFGPFAEQASPIYDGFITFDDVHFYAPTNTGGFGMVFGRGLTDIIIKNCTITGFHMWITWGDHACRRILIRNNLIQNTESNGILGSCTDLVIEGNHFYHCNTGGDNGSHSIYLANGSYPLIESRIMIRNNYFEESSVPGGGAGGQSTGGWFTCHGAFDQIFLDHNLFRSTSSGGGAYGISLTRGYLNIQEFFRRCKIRGNTLVNLGSHFIAVSGAVDVLIENNLCYHTQSSSSSYITVPVNGGDFTDPDTDDNDNGAIVRNNTVYATNPSSGSIAFVFRSSDGNAGADITFANNFVFNGGTAGNMTAFAQHGAGNFDAINNNVFYNCTPMSGSASITAMQNTLNGVNPGVAANNSSSTPNITVAPSSGNDYIYEFGSGSLTNAGWTSQAPIHDVTGKRRATGVIDVGCIEEAV